MKSSLNTHLSGLIAALLMLSLNSPAHAEKTFQMAALAPASTSAVFSIALSEVLKKKYDYGFQISTGTAATRQAVDAANKNLDLFVTAVSINHYMQNNLAMFAKMDDAKILFGNLRGLANYPLGAYQPIVWADSGITSYKDIKGKKVFTGPPSGAARPTTENLILGMTGYKPNEDFVRVNLDWSTAQQAFRDRQIDVYFLPTSIPSPQLEEFSAVGKIRILSVTDDAVATEAVQKAASMPGRKFTYVPVGTYTNLVNSQPARVLDSTVGLGTNKWMSTQDAYNITKAIFENKADLVAAGKWMNAITPETAVAEMNMPLHKGAAQYYREIGVKIPESAQPID